MTKQLQVMDRKENFKIKSEWQAKYLTQIEEIIRLNLWQLIDIRLGTLHEDTKQAADMVLEISGATIGVRIRKDSYKFRDFTIRSSMPSGHETEIDKLRAGYGDWYIYAWCNDKLITEFMIVDLHKMRASGLLNEKHLEKQNPDGTKFIIINPDQLRQVNALIAHAKINHNGGKQ